MSILLNTAISYPLRLPALVLFAMLSLLLPTLFAQVPVISGGNTAIARVGVAFTYRIKASNKPTNFTARNLPLGLSINPKTGVIRGTPQKAGTFKVSTSAVNSFGSANGLLELHVDSNKAVNLVYVRGGILQTTNSLNGTSVSNFRLGKFEVTWKEWQDVTSWARGRGYRDLSNSYVGQGSAGNHPVRRINWFDAIKWCNARSEFEGLRPVYRANGKIFRVGEFGIYSNTVKGDRSANGYRLPTESEWEWAARGGVSSRRFDYSGGNNPDKVGWHRGNSRNASPFIENGRGTWPVGRKKANELGIHDMSGNVWEWCWAPSWDWPDPYENRPGRHRGGSWDYDSYEFRLGERILHANADSRYDDIGFRLARNAP